MGKLARWRLWRTKFEVDVVYRSVVQKRSVDSFFVCTAPEKADKNVDDEITLFAVQQHSREENSRTNGSWQGSDIR